jgi:HSP20 family molecular chaperone IbpA
VVDTDRLTATFKQGVLELHAPKVEAAVPKKIQLTA